MNTPIPALAVVGPTASGKSALGIWLAEQGFPIEIVSLDSALVFKDMNIGTAKPSAAELGRVPHHLIDLITPQEVFNAADFLTQATLAVADIVHRRKVPVILGGTMMYYKALVCGIDDLPPANSAIRQEIEHHAAQFGWPAVHQQLAQVDPVAAARLAPNDSQRLQRALEVHRITGRSLSSFHSRHAKQEKHLPTLSIEPSDRAVLHTRIAARFEDMLKNGLVEEVIALQHTYDLHPALPSMRCVGYRQVLDSLQGRITHAQMVENGIVATRQLAKRQMTWLRSTPNRTVVDPLQHGWMDRAKLWLEVQIQAQIKAWPPT